MRIKSGFVLDKRSGKVVGFTSQGDFNEELIGLSRLASDNIGSEPEVATHISVFMVRGIITHHSILFIWYPLHRIHQSSPLGSSVGGYLSEEDVGLWVRMLVCDGASPNRKFFQDP